MKQLLEDEGKELFIFMDGINGLIDENSLTGYNDKDGTALQLKSLPLCTQFFATQMKGNVKIAGALTHSNPSLPRDHQFPPNSKTIQIPNYSNEELKRVLQLYSQLGHCSSNKTDQFVAFKHFVSGGNPRKLYKSCEYDSIYYKQ